MDDVHKGQRAVTDRVVARRLKAAREHAGLTQEEAAKKIGFSTAMLAGIEQAGKGVSFWVLQKMARVYGRDEYYLFTGKTPAVPQATEELADLVSVLTPEPKQTRQLVVRRALEHLRDLKVAREQSDS